MSERQIHDAFIAWLKKREIPFITHRMDRKSGIATGWPDFTVLWMSRVMCIEIKTAKGRLSNDQERVIAFIRRSGNRVEVCRSCEECIEAVTDILCEGKLGAGDTPTDVRTGFRKEFAELKRAVGSKEDLHRDGVYRVGAVSGGVEGHASNKGSSQVINTARPATSGNQVPSTQVSCLACGAEEDAAHFIGCPEDQPELFQGGAPSSEEREFIAKLNGQDQVFFGTRKRARLVRAASISDLAMIHRE